GIPGAGLAPSRLQRGVCQGARLDGRASPVPRVRHGGRPEDLAAVRVPGPRLLFLLGGPQEAVRGGPREVHEPEPALGPLSPLLLQKGVRTALARTSKSRDAEAWARRRSVQWPK